MMRAWVMTGIGGPEVYAFMDLPTPEPGEGEVQVRVDGAGLNPVDWKIRQGLYPPAMPKSFPAINLREFSGTLSKVGPGVTEWQVGDGVFGITGRGAAAEFTVAAAGDIGPRPPSMDPADAAIVPLAASTAWQALFDHGGVTAGQRVLIHAASGGVGTFAVQLAKWKGATVIATTTKANAHLVQEIGADQVIDYKAEAFERATDSVDMVLHSIGQEDVARSRAILKPGGILVAISADPEVEQAKAEGKRAMIFSMTPSTAQLREISGLIEDLKVRPVISTIVPWDRAPEAMAELEEGHTVGKIGLRISG